MQIIVNLCVEARYTAVNCKNCKPKSGRSALFRVVIFLNEKKKIRIVNIILEIVTFLNFSVFIRWDCM
jgi:hypothetical protein